MLEESKALRIYSAPLLGCPVRCLSPQHVPIALDSAPNLAFHSFLWALCAFRVVLSFGMTHLPANA